MKNHILDYFILFTAGVFFIIAFYVFRGERLIQFLILAGFTSFYILWGLYHHLVRDKLHLKTIIEYIFFGFIALLLLKIIIFPF